MIDEWYLFPTLVDNTVNKAAYTDLQSYIDALVAPARAQSKDRFFTYVTSAQEEDDLINSGATAGFGVRFGFYNDGGTLRIIVTDSMEGAPALGQNIDRGDELLGVQTQGQPMLLINSLPATNQSVEQVFNALGPDTPGTTRILRIKRLGGATQDISLSKANFSLPPVSSRFGAQVIMNGATKVGYINLRTFIIESAEQDLRDAMADFKAQGITQVIVDLRYNGGGLVNLANVFADLMSGGKAGQVMSYTTLRPDKSSENRTRNFASQTQAIAAMKIAFIGSGSSASASELLMNTFPPYLQNNVALIGSNTYGKPVGQFGFDDTSNCDDRLRVIAFKTENADHEGEYFTGLASTMPVTCSATDDVFHLMGDPAETMTSAALNWLAGGACTKIPAAKRDLLRLLQPARPTTAQHEIPGLY